VGSSGADTLSITGSVGANVWAGGGSDAITLGGGADKVLFKSAAESGLGVSGDTITGFNAGSGTSSVDQLYLLGLVQGTMSFVGHNAFSATLGQTEVRAIDGATYGGLAATDTVVQIDLDGNGTTDMEIKLLGTNVNNIDSGDIFGG